MVPVGWEEKPGALGGCSWAVLPWDCSLTHVSPEGAPSLGALGPVCPPSSGTRIPDPFLAIAPPEESGINSRAMSFVLPSLPLCQSLPECQRHWHTPWRGRASPSPQSPVVSCARTVLLWGARLGTAGATGSGSARVGCPEPGAVPGQSAHVCSHGRSTQVSSHKAVIGSCGSSGSCWEGSRGRSGGNRLHV